MELNQCLHGYKDGHQLLASSIELPGEVRKTLLLQSDLSGPSLEKGFEEYVSGYPLPEIGSYAFAKTWYAAEMKRPGCVWTQTLLIEFADLAKVNDFISLLNHFVRPDKDGFDYYFKKINLEPTENYPGNDERNEWEKLITFYLYEYPASPIIIPAKTSKDHDSEVLRIWSRQWPRLRRNFTFCTGALSLRSIDDKNFDLQIVPEQSTSTIKRQNDTAVIVNPEENPSATWLMNPEKYKSDLVREFLWTVGSEIGGLRANYIPLIKIMDLIGGDEFDLLSIHNTFQRNFPKPEEAKQLKKYVFGPENKFRQLNFEREITAFLILQPNIGYLKLDDLDLNNRLVQLFKSNDIDFHKLLYLWKNKADERRIDAAIWREVSLSEDEILISMIEDPSLINELKENLPVLAMGHKIWRSEAKIQEGLIKNLFENRNKHDNKQYIFSILDAESDVISHAFSLLGAEIIDYSLEWLVSSKGNRRFPKMWRKQLFSKHINDVFRWIEKRQVMSAKLFELLLQDVEPYKLSELYIPWEMWVAAYNELKKAGYDIDHAYLSCALLSLSLEAKRSGYEGIIATVFIDAYNYAGQSKIDEYSWRILKKETFLDDERSNMPFGFFSFLNPENNNYAKYNVSYWDYCEYLMRTVSNAFVRQRWSSQVFLDTFKTGELFTRVIKYLSMYQRGRIYLSAILSEREKLRIAGAQLEYILMMIKD
jgi:hypothetical protein